jgi:hypothetical protein
MPERLIFAYDADSGLRAMLVDVLKKAVGREDCPLCEITYGSLGKRRQWTECEARIGMAVEELHRDRIPEAWGIGRLQLPCVLIEREEGNPSILIPRSEIVACTGRTDELERRIVAALAGSRAQATVAEALRC